MKMNVRINSAVDAVNFVNKLSRYDCEADMNSGNHYIDAKSMLSVLVEAVGRDMTLEIHDNNLELQEELREFAL